MIYQSGSQIRDDIIEGKYSVEDVTRVHIEHIQQFNPTVNAVVYEHFDAALMRARTLDKMRKEQDKLPVLFGVPVTIKESFKMLGTPSTINYPPLKNYVADEDSILVQRLYDAGAVILGKTNIPTMLSDSQTFGPLYPRCNNPYDISRVPGGSSGGSACAIAAGFSALELGSDIGGSIRNPSHYCGLYGLKPTQNMHIQDGHIPPLPGKKMGYAALASSGPIARTMTDLALMYSELYKARPEYRRYLPLESKSTPPSSLKGLKIAYFDDVLGLSAGREVKAALAKVKTRLEAQGAILKKIHLDNNLCTRITKSWAGLFGCVAGQDFNWVARKVMKMMFAKDMKQSRMDVKDALSDGLSMDFQRFSQALYEQQECIAEFYQYFDQFDFILSPTSPGPAFEHNPKHNAIPLDGELIAYPDYCFLFVILYNLLELPVLTFPTGLGQSGLPIGLSLSAPHYAEESLIALGHLLEAEGFVFSKPELEKLL